jgi:site-specific DNA-cytosine methylase
MSMVDVLLTHSNHLYNDPKQVRKMQPYPPLQTLVVAACLRARRILRRAVRFTFEEPEAGFARALEAHRPRMVAVCEGQFQLPDQDVPASQSRVGLLDGGDCAQGKCPCNCERRRCHRSRGRLSACRFHVRVKGEVEHAIVEAARLELEKAGAPEQIRGIAYLDPCTSELKHTPPRAPIENLDTLPMPAWDLVNAEPYRRAWTSAHGYFSLNMVSSRGCPYRCNWCAKPIWSDNYRCRSAHLVAEEMLDVKTRFRPDHSGSPTTSSRFRSSGLRNSPPAVGAPARKFRFKMQSRCDLMTRADRRRPRIARAAPKSGWAWSPARRQVLDAMDKGTRLWQIPERSRESAPARNPRLLLPAVRVSGRDLDRDRKDRSRWCATRAGRHRVSVSYPLPGHRLSPDGLEPTWARRKTGRTADDLDMMFQGAFTTEFYRALADALHAEVRDGRAAPTRPGRTCLALKETCARRSRYGSPADARIFSGGRSEGAQIMKPYAPLGNSVPVVVPARKGLAVEDLRFHLSDTRASCSAFWKRSRRRRWASTST